jgi:aminoglycoside 6'-N-acetyltransferase I
MLRIVDLAAQTPEVIHAAARILVDGFADTGATSWRTVDEALETVHESLAEGRISRAAMDEGDALVGWIGAIPQYSGHAWELHPLVVHRDCRRRGVGRALVGDLEEQVRSRGATTLYLGTDDEDGRTSIAGVDLYPDVLGTLVRIRNRRDHPFEFYLKIGFAIVGAIPDANGFGKPDILMAKRVTAAKNPYANRPERA